MPNYRVADENDKTLGYSYGENHEEAFFNFENGSFLLTDTFATFEELPPVSVEDGKSYITRSRQVIGPMMPLLNSHYEPEWKWTYKGFGPGEVWRSDGTYGKQIQYDLMQEVDL